MTTVPFLSHKKGDREYTWLGLPRGVTTARKTSAGNCSCSIIICRKLPSRPLSSHLAHTGLLVHQPQGHPHRAHQQTIHPTNFPVQCARQIQTKPLEEQPKTLADILRRGKAHDVRSASMSTPVPYSAQVARQMEMVEGLHSTCSFNNSHIKDDLNR